MSDRIKVQDGRRAPFLWCSLAAMLHLRATLPPGQKLIGARNVYVGIAELAADRYDGQHDGFEATRAEIADKAGITDRRVGDHLGALEAVGLLEITARTALTGATLPAVYCLKEPQVSVEVAIAQFVELEAKRRTDRGGDETSPHQESAQTFRRGGDEVSGSRSRVKSELQEEGMTEGPGARAREAGEGGKVLAELQALAADRGIELDQAAVVDAIRAHPGIAHLTAAQRLRETYASNGTQGRRTIRNLAGIFRAELDQRQPVQPRRSRRGAKTPPAAGARSTTYTLKVHREPPAGLERPGPKLLAAWDTIRTHLEQSCAEQQSTWHLWLDPLDLAGFLETVVTELGDDEGKVRRVLVLTTPALSASWVANSLGRLLEGCAAAVLGPNVAVELLPVEHRSAA